jgi:hypothetical protein
LPDGVKFCSMLLLATSVPKYTKKPAVGLHELPEADMCSVSSSCFAQGRWKNHVLNPNIDKLEQQFISKVSNTLTTAITCLRTWLCAGKLRVVLFCGKLTSREWYLLHCNITRNVSWLKWIECVRNVLGLHSFKFYFSITFCNNIRS